jgi:DNA-binding NarL/FixJ family response regulator
MRKLLHMSSRLEPHPSSTKSSIGRVESRTLGLHVSPRLDKAVTQADSQPVIPSIQEAGLVPASPPAVRYRSGAQAAPCKRKPAYSNASDAALNSRNHADIDAQRASSEAPDFDAVNGEESGAVNPKPGIVVIDSRAVFRDCFARCLEVAYGDHEIFSFANLAEWCNSREPNALAAAVIIIVIDSGDEFDFASLEFLETAAANIPVVIVSDVDDLNHIVRTLKSGVRGYIPTSLPFNIAVEAVRLVKAGGTFVPASSFVHDRNAPQPAPKTGVLLTERQMKVVEEICHGKANKQIAYELHMSEHTVKVHLRHIMRKLKARNRTEVAVLSRDLFAGSKDVHREGSGIGSDKDIPPV